MSSGSNIPTGWTMIEGFYTNTVNSNPLLEVVVSCPTAGQKMKRVVDENGVDLDALSMIYAALSSSSSVLSALSASAASATATASSTVIQCLSIQISNSWVHLELVRIGPLTQLEQ